MTGYDLGMNTPGGFGEYISVPKEWVTLLPDNLGDSESMILGTAGMTAGLCVNAIQKKHKIAIVNMESPNPAIALYLASRTSLLIISMKPMNRNMIKLIVLMVLDRMREAIPSR